MGGNMWLPSPDGLFRELDRRGWERDGNQWSKYPFVLGRHIVRKPMDAREPFIVLWHLERVDVHPGHAWFTNGDILDLFTIVDAEMAAWQ